jgi:hypothetical protein
MLTMMRSKDRDEALTQRSSIRAWSNAARWQWCLEQDDGELIAAMMVVPDGPGRGWLAAYPGQSMMGMDLRPMLRLWKIYQRYAPQQTIRAWVASEDNRAIKFARSFGFVYDCGPATGFSRTGRDMDLFLWRQTNG